MYIETSRNQEHLYASLRRLDESDDLYRIWIDGPILRVNARGSWTKPVAETYIREIRRIIAALRNQSPALRAIVDRSDTPVFQPEVHELLVATYAGILREGDRIALIVNSSMVKGDIRRLTDREETRTFLSLSAAKTWVLAYG